MREGVEALFLRELLRLNSHLPKRRVTLREALQNPEVELVDGGKHKFRRSELEFLKSLVPEEEWDSLRLPVLIELDPKLGRGAARIRGAAECRAVARILGKEEEPELILYLPEISELRGKLPTLTDYFLTA